MPSEFRIDWRDDETLSFISSPLTDAVDPIDGLGLTEGELIWRCDCHAAYRDSSYAFLIRQNNGVCVTCGTVGSMHPEVVTTGMMRWTPVDDTPAARLQRALATQSESGVATTLRDSAIRYEHPLSRAGLSFGVTAFFLNVWIVIPILAILCSATSLAGALLKGGRGSASAWIGLALGSIYTLFAVSR